jgi:hypothetical protein
LPPPDKIPQTGNGNSETRRVGGRPEIVLEPLNYNSDIDALRRLAEVSPILARRVIDQRDRENLRENVSYRFAIVGTCVLLIAALALTFGCLAYVGFWATFGLIGVLFAVALLVRVVLTGEWSDTSWFGSLVHLLAKVLGSKSEPPDETDTTA